MTLRRRRILLASILSLVAIAGTLFALLRFGPVPVSNPRILFDFLTGRGIASPSAAQVAHDIKAPAGFRVQVYAADVPLARVVLVTPDGDLIVSRTRNDAIVLLERDRNGDGAADGQRALLGPLDGPHGLALHDGWLYVAERTAIGRVRFDSKTGTTTGAYEHIYTGITKDGFHQTRTIAFGPDGWLYLTQGSNCNACVEKDTRRATMMRMRPDGSEAQVYATGLRNSVGFDWAPWDGALYATDNGRDLLGDDFPPDELNRIEAGRFYGWPYVNGFGVADPDLGAQYAGTPPATDPVHGFRPHNAPLGIHFLRALPGYERTALVALHGSWNRRTLDGYKVVALHWKDDGSIEEADFLTGFLGPDGVIGRPAWIAESADGAVFISDDYGGVIYRVSAAPTH